MAYINPLAIIALLLSLLSGCSGNDDESLTMDRLRISVLPDQSEAELRERFTPLLDYLLLEICLDNLFGNAWKYTRKVDYTCIEFGAVKQKGEVMYFVKDNGIGFDMQYAHKLFKPFQRLDKSGDYPGTGVGLATVERVIQRHGGSIRAESEPGEGAAFFFTLPPTKL